MSWLLSQIGWHLRCLWRDLLGLNMSDDDRMDNTL